MEMVSGTVNLTRNVILLANLIVILSYGLPLTSCENQVTRLGAIQNKDHYKGKYAR